MITHKQGKTIVPETERSPVTQWIAHWTMVWRTWFCRNAKVAARQEVACVLPHARKFTARNCISVDVHRLIPRPTCACRLLKCKKKFNCTHAERLDTKLYSSWARPITYSQLLHVVNYPNYWCVQEHHDCGEFTTSLLWPVLRIVSIPFLALMRSRLTAMLSISTVITNSSVYRSGYRYLSEVLSRAFFLLAVSHQSERDQEALPNER